jgi:hypothetical protein
LYDTALVKKPGVSRAFALPIWQIAYFCCGAEAGLVSGWVCCLSLWFCCCGVACGLPGVAVGFWVSFEEFVIGFPFEKTEKRIQYIA